MRSAVTLLVVLGLCAGVSPAVADESPNPTVSESPTASPTPTTTTTVTPGPYSIPLGQNIREDAWCRLLVPNKKGDAAEPQGEAIGFSVDGRSYFTSTERVTAGQPVPLNVVTCQ